MWHSIISRCRTIQSLEQLEDRTAPAGNVLADLAGTTLTLVGDALSNNVRLLPGSVPNEIVVKGVGTTVNGSSQQTFSGVENLFAHLLDGNDTLRVDGVVISNAPFSQVFVDGNAGDDQIEFIDTTIDAINSITFDIYGERVFENFASGTSGNDTILLKGTSLICQFFIVVTIVGEQNNGGVITGGNDTISIVDSNIVATGGFFHSVLVAIQGDVNASDGGQTSTIGGGNDEIDVRNTTIAAASDLFSSGNLVNLTIVGDHNVASGFNPDTSSGEDAASTIGGGNDSITVQETTVSVSGENSGTSQAILNIVGEHVSSDGFPGGTAAATVGGGNDSIRILDSTVFAAGATSNLALTDIQGEEVFAVALEGATAASTIGGGNDNIDVKNVTIDAVGQFNDVTALNVRGDFASAFGTGTIVIGGGNDDVRLNNVQLPGTNIDDFRAVVVVSGSGNDHVDIIDSTASLFFAVLEDGNDELRFNSNVVHDEASLDGGPGFDRISAHDNTGGLLTWFNFEDENVTP
jgi:hypothetical protein